MSRRLEKKDGAVGKEQTYFLSGEESYHLQRMNRLRLKQRFDSVQAPEHLRVAFPESLLPFPLPLSLPIEGSGCLGPEKMSRVTFGVSLGK